MTRALAKAVKQSIKKSGVRCNVILIGTGKYQSVGIWGPSAPQVAAILDRKLVRSPMSFDGSDRTRMIVFDDLA